MHDGVQHAGIIEGQRGPVSNLCWQYQGVVKANKNKAVHRDILQSSIGFCSIPSRSLKFV